MARVFCAFIVTTAVLSAVHAMPSYPAKMPNGANVAGVKAIGHTDGTGETSPMTKFGLGFATAKMEWSKAFCQEDSDGDGQTNGQELGDPCCEWKVGATPKFTTGVSHPGDATKKVDAAVLAKFTCGAGGGGGGGAAGGGGAGGGNKATDKKSSCLRKNGAKKL